MRISDWSSDVCSSDLRTSNWLRGSSNAGKPHSYSVSFSGYGLCAPVRRPTSIGKNTNALESTSPTPRNSRIGTYCDRPIDGKERESGEEGQSVAVRVERGGRRQHKKNSSKNK